jgi:FKBP-type peptidyl-prolyl cis-trans isomerase FkpA
MIRKLFFIVCLSGVILSCKKTADSNNCVVSSFIAPAFEVTQLSTYAPIDAIADPSGFYYVISNPGSDSIPTICSTVNVTYTGNLLPDNTEFDKAINPVNFYLGGLILGWQKGIPLIGKGGSITLYLPPSLAYGAGGAGPVPGNAYLRFDIQLVTFQ